MNLAVRKFIFLFFSITALIACDDPGEIGLELQEGNQFGTEFTDTVTINTGTVLLNDSVSSFRLTPSSVGYYTDSELGNLKATTYAEVGIGSSDLTTAANTLVPTPDSLVLTLDYSFIYRNTFNNLEIDVHELTQGFESEGTYFTNTKLAFQDPQDPEKPNKPIGSSTFVPTLLPNANNQDSAVVVRIKLDQEVANRLFAQAGKTSLTSQQEFNRIFKGIAIVPAPNTIPAGIVGFNLNSTASAMRLYYKVTVDGADVQKVHVFPLSGAEVSNYFSVEADRSGKTIGSLKDYGSYIAASETGNVSYVQANTQLLTKITFPYLNKFTEEKKNIVINRAELILPVKPGSNTILPSHPSLVLYESTNSNLIKKNENGTPLVVQQEGTYNLNTTQYPAPVVYNASKRHYRLNMTSYVQGLIYGSKTNTGLLLSSGSAGLVVGSQLSERQVIQEPRPYRTIISNTAAEPVKLLIYYSKLN